eukprot:CAMPEP_0179106338 /NCGR_PEP_ID=MMETSP0796-20121207/49437_1 /TAXON_ID=73915 /ORGANISM="Pyrodinium bahamense, Strain pbaha01" /LENGTH=456 /DNA_ID=CAMNT_0020804363 /DNA_START=12 /DNA_END=1382 /DNA_ORIENTATION=+
MAWVIVDAAAVYNGSIDFQHMNSIADHRSDFCVQERALANGSQMVGNVLGGLHISFGIPKVPPAWFDENTMTGFHARLISEVAKVGEFNYTIISFPRTLPFTEYFNRILDRFDVVVHDALATAERANMGMMTPFPIVDLSLYAMEYRERASTNWFKFASPLSIGLWMAFIATSIFTSILYQWVEKVRATPERKYPVTDIIYRGFAAFTGSASFEPRTRGGKLMTLTYTFFILVLVASYTANLAAVLVSKQKESSCHNFHECTHPGTKTSVCLLGASAVEEEIVRRYPYLDTTSRLVRSEYPVNDMQAGKCDIAIEPKTDHDFALLDKRINPKCNLYSIGSKPVVTMTGGWFVKVRHSEKCTNVLRDALGAILTQLGNDGFIEKSYYRMMHESTTATCGDRADKEEEVSLPVDCMLGFFVIHGAAVANWLELLLKPAGGPLAARPVGLDPPAYICLH